MFRTTIFHFAHLIVFNVQCCCGICGRCEWRSCFGGRECVFGIHRRFNDNALVKAFITLYSTMEWMCCLKWKSRDHNRLDSCYSDWAKHLWTHFVILLWRHKLLLYYCFIEVSNISNESNLASLKYLFNLNLYYRVNHLNKNFKP